MEFSFKLLLRMYFVLQNNLKSVLPCEFFENKIMDYFKMILQEEWVYFKVCQ